MSCGNNNKEHSTVENMRELAKKAAKMDQKVYILFKKEDGTYEFYPENTPYNGELIEYIFY